MAQVSPSSKRRALRASAAFAPHGGRLGPWRLERLLGEGEFTRVFLARPADAVGAGAAGYAIKVLREGWQDDERARACLAREFEAAAAVRHPRLISLLSAELQRSPCYLVMPQLAGRTLAARLSAGELPALPMALCLARQVCEALGALHAAGWTHGDVKPSNVFVSPEGHVTLLDLGFARRRDELRAGGQVLGSLAYMAPERITSVLRPDIRSDLYSLGVMLYELLTGGLPFACSDMAELARRQISDAPTPVRRGRPEVPREVAELVRQLLCKDPLRRPQTPEELLQRLVDLEISTFAVRVPARAGRMTPVSRSR